MKDRNDTFVSRTYSSLGNGYVLPPVVLSELTVLVGEQGAKGLYFPHSSIPSESETGQLSPQVSGGTETGADLSRVSGEQMLDLF